MLERDLHRDLDYVLPTETRTRSRPVSCFFFIIYYFFSVLIYLFWNWAGTEMETETKLGPRLWAGTGNRQWGTDTDRGNWLHLNLAAWPAASWNAQLDKYLRRRPSHLVVVAVVNAAAVFVAAAVVVVGLHSPLVAHKFSLGGTKSKEAT